MPKRSALTSDPKCRPTITFQVMPNSRSNSVRRYAATSTSRLHSANAFVAVDLENSIMMSFMSAFFTMGSG